LTLFWPPYVIYPIFYLVLFKTFWLHEIKRLLMPKHNPTHDILSLKAIIFMFWKVKYLTWSQLRQPPYNVTCYLTGFLVFGEDLVSNDCFAVVFLTFWQKRGKKFVAEEKKIFCSSWVRIQNLLNSTISVVKKSVEKFSLRQMIGLQVSFYFP